MANNVSFNGLKLSRHPYYAQLAKGWSIYKALFDGDHDVLVGEEFLWAHLLEKTEDGQKIRQIRELRTRYTNYFEAVVSCLISLMFKNEPDYSDIDKAISEEERKNINGKRMTLTSFIQSVMRDYIIYGRPFIFVDSFNVKAKTKFEAKKLGIRPFMETLSPLSVVDWEIETEDLSKYGQFKWLRFEYEYIAPRADERVQPVLSRRSTALKLSGGSYAYEVYESNQKPTDIIKISDELWKPISGLVSISEIQEVPVCSIWDMESWMKDVAQECLRHHNLASTYDNCLNNQAYQRSFVAGNIKDENWKQIGEYVIGRLPDGAVVHTIEPADTTSLRERLVQCINDIYKLAFNQSRSLPADSKGVESMVTIRERKEELHSLLESSIEEVQNLVNNAVRLYAQFKGIKDYDQHVKFSTDVSSEDIDEQIKIYSAVRDRIAKYPTWQKESDKKFAELQNLPQIGDIKAEIENTAAQVQAETQAENNPQQQQPATIRGRLAQQVNQGSNNAVQVGA